MCPAIIQSNQVYRPGEIPVYVAYIYTGAGTAKKPVLWEDLNAITVNHMESREGVRNGRVVETWHPVEFPGGSYEDVSISIRNVYNELIPINGTGLFAYAQGNRTMLGSAPNTSDVYNFLYIPTGGRNYYQREGRYRTIFTLDFAEKWEQQLNPDYDPTDPESEEYISVKTQNSMVDIITFESEARTEYDDPYFFDRVQGDNLQIDDEGNQYVPYGHNISFQAEIYSKYYDKYTKEIEAPDLGDGYIYLLDNVNNQGSDLRPLEDRIREIYVSVFDLSTSQTLIDREGIWNNNASIDENGNQLATVTNAKDFNYIFETNKVPFLPRIQSGNQGYANYRFRFEVEVWNEQNIDRDTNILCVFDIDVLLG